jgi:endonuclease/exonuclease/phosphatase family metal-dependent hydrolase
MINFIFRPIFSITIIVIALLVVQYGCKTTDQQASQNYKESTESNTFRVMFYNVENLYDIEDDPVTNDSEFLPDGSYKWDSYKYNDKLQKLAKVIVAVGGEQGNGLVGLCEIENRKVLSELIRFTPMAAGGYEILHHDSRDYRGSDVALLYKKTFFRLLYFDFHEFNAPGDSTRTRDILYAKGIVKNTDTLHVFVNHWPSRRGGKEQSERKREISASILKAKVDSIFRINMAANIIIMGDFNDEPTDNSIYGVLQAKDSSGLQPGGLYNFMYASKKKGAGSYKYQSEWNMLDQIMASYQLVARNGLLHAGYQDARICKFDWIMTDDTKFPGKKPFRTFQGPKYLGGYSDHLPVYLDIKVSSKSR